MENLYKVDKIEGKGVGCIALQDIKPGTLILKEVPQCVAKKGLVYFSQEGTVLYKLKDLCVLSHFGTFVLSYFVS